MKTHLFSIQERERAQLTHKLLPFNPKSIIKLLIINLYTLTIILTSCSVDLDSGNGVKTMTTGAEHTVALKDDGTLWAWGRNDNYVQLGLGDTTNRNSPEQIEINKIYYPSAIDTDWIAVSSLGYCTVALKEDGSLWTWGVNGRGQLGNESIPTGVGGRSDTPVPVKRSGVIDRDWEMASAGSQQIVALKKDGSLWAWGDNNYGQLGRGSHDGTAHSNPTELLGADSNGKPFKDYRWKTVSAGNSHIVAIKDDGTLWAWGNNEYGQLGKGDGYSANTIDNWEPAKIEINKANYKDAIDTDWFAVFAGSMHTVAIKTDGSLWAWGRNDGGQLGDGTGGDDTDVNNKPTPVPVKINGVIDKDWESVSGGLNHTIAHKRNGTLWAWGKNGDGQLGLGDKIIRTIPTRLGVAADLVGVSAGEKHSAALRRSGILWTWGSNGYGQLGDGTTNDRSRPGVVKWE